MRMYLFDTMLACGMYISTKILDHRYNLGVKGQGHIYLKINLQLETRTSFTVFGGGCSYLAQINITLE